jgi:N-acetyl-gamma-glutamylphosphate reductase
LVEFLIENGKTESHFKQANLWNSRELKKEVNFNRAKHQVQIAVKLSDMNQAKIWAKVVIEQASKEGVKLAAEDQWIIDLSKDKRIKNSG